MSFLKRLVRRRKPDEPSDTPEQTDAPTPGWDALDRHLDRRYPGQEPRHWGTAVRWSLGGPDPLDGVSVYRADGPPRHWHYASYGLSELYAKEWPDPDRSGWGIELTFRLARTRTDQGPAPQWPVQFLQYLARYVFESGNVLWPGHHMSAHGPIAADEDTDLQAAVFVEDPELGRIDTPNGHVRFVQVVGITDDEYDAIRRWNADSFVGLLQAGNPLLVTDLQRRSILDDPATAAEVARRRRAEGSSMAGVFVDQLDWSQSPGALDVTIGAAAVDDLRIMLDGRLALGREAFLGGEGRRLDLVPGEKFGWHGHEEGSLGLTLPRRAVTAIATLPPRAGEYTWLEAPGLTIRVEPTIVTGGDGAEVSRIG